jgi:DegV family protein with EDD domain
MAIKIVTDSTADLPPGAAEELGITVVPLYVRFGDDVLRDRVDISEDQFYHRLTHDPVHPGTTQPTPEDFAEVYRRLAQEGDGIVSVHLSGKLSGTYNSALQARDIVGDGCPIAVIDSQWTSIALGMLAMEAAGLAAQGGTVQQIVDGVNDSIPRIHLRGMFDTLKYLYLGGRIGKGKALMGSMLNVKPLLALQDGEMLPVGRARTRSRGIEKLHDFVEGASDIQDLIVVHSTTPDDAEALADRCGSFFPRERIVIARLGAVLGVHTGPGTLFAGYRRAAS